MQHAIVTRTAVVVAGLLVGASLLFAWSVRGAPGPPADGQRPDAGSFAAAPPGEELFTRHCAKCHSVEQMMRSFPEARAAAADGNDLLSLLDDHGAAEPDQDQAIVEFLWTEVWRRRGSPPADTK